MTEAEALRVLGLDTMHSQGAGPHPAIDAEAVRTACSAQMRLLREARGDAGSAHERQRIDRALTLTLLARERLLPADDRAHAVTQEMAPVPRPGLARHALALLCIGVIMMILGLLPQPGSQFGDTGRDAAERVSAGESSAISRALLDSVRLDLQARWRQVPSARLPVHTDLGSGELPPLPAEWRWQSQRDGAFAIIHASGEDWLLAAPLLEDGSLYWACFSARSGRAGCQVLADDPIVDRRLPRGQVGARLLAEALARLPASLRQDGWAPERWYRQALRQRGADRLGQRRDESEQVMRKRM